MYGNITRQCISVRSLAPVAAGTTTPQNGSVVDANGATAIRHTVSLGTLTATQTTVVKAQSGDASDGSDMADITGASYTVLDTDSNKMVQIEIFKPTKRYHRLVVTRGVANAAIELGITETFHNPKLPITQDASVTSVICKQGT